MRRCDGKTKLSEKRIEFLNFVFNFRVEPLLATFNINGNVVEYKNLVSTHVKYAKPLTMLFDSINNRLANANDVYNRMILVVNGSEADSVTTSNYSNSTNSLTVVTTPMNNLEYTVFSMVAKYKDDDRVRSEYYFTMHDTCTVDDTFFSKLLSFDQIVETKEYSFVRPEGAGSNIMIVSMDAVLRFAPTVPFIKTKAQAVDVELGRPLQTPDGGEQRLALLYDFKEKPTYCCYRRRELSEEKKDLYETGHARSCYYYKAFGVKKYILLMRYGDFDTSSGGGVKNIW